MTKLHSVSSELAWHIHEHTIPAALDLLPGRMDTPAARAMLIAIAYQESDFRARRQKVKPGVPPPASGLWQFEKRGGVAEVLTSHDTKDLIVPICKMLIVDPTPAAVHEAIVYHDVLACCFARLLLYRDPRVMPRVDQEELGWSIYMRNWRPGKPHPETWKQNFTDAWCVVLEE